MGSTRLPGKVLMNVGGEPLLVRILNKVMPLMQDYQIFVATTTNTIDDVLEQTCRSLGVECYRGSETDVLTRFYKLAELKNLDVIVRLNADCPMLSASFVKKQIIQFLDEKSKYDYASTILSETYPVGMHVEIIRFEALKIAHLNCLNAELREHVTPYIYQNPNLFKLLSIKSGINLSSLRLTIDYDVDISFINALIEKLVFYKKSGTISDILWIIKKHPELKLINQNIKKLQRIL